MLLVENLSAGYEGKIVLRDLSFGVNQNEIVSILGANGCGKSTLLKAICGALPYGGKIAIDSQDAAKFSAKERARFFAFVPQSSYVPFAFSALEIALAGRFCQSPFSLDYSKADKEAALNALETVGAARLKERVFNSLSGGERQLVIIARALAQETKIIALDEPVTGLDMGNQMRLLTLLQELRSQGKTIIQTTHYPDHALSVSDRVLWLSGGEASAFGKPTEVITTERIKAIYGVESELYRHQSGKTFLLPIKTLKRQLATD
jgi:iron complex transport system ATP-binding protein